MSEDDCWAKLVAARHGVLATVHAQRGVDAVPVVFIVRGRELVVPIDTVKAKRTSTLQRLVNVRRDPRCVLLVDHYDDDWSRLWWVRAHATATEQADEPLLGDHFPEYRAPGAVASCLVLTPTAVTGWAA